MHTYQYDDDEGVWAVGYYDPAGVWHILAHHEEANAAAQEVAQLNGGINAHLCGPLAELGASIDLHVLMQLQQLREQEEVLREQVTAHAHQLADLRDAAEQLVRCYLGLHIYGFACAKGKEEVAEFRAAFARLGEVLGIS